jgi:peptide/nickel transport system substrate-binding protein
MKTSSNDGESFGRSASNTLTRRDVLATAAVGAIAVPGMAFAAAPQGQLTLALHVSLAPTWFDPAETQALITPFMVLYALHDAMLKPMSGEL